MANKKLNNSISNTSSDHDLLIQVNTKLERVIDDIRELTDNVANRVNHLEDGKMDKAEADRLKAESDIIHTDHEDRLRSLEMWRWGIAGGVIVLQLLSPILFKYLGFFK